MEGLNLNYFNADFVAKKNCLLVCLKIDSVAPVGKFIFISEFTEYFISLQASETLRETSSTDKHSPQHNQ